MVTSRIKQLGMDLGFTPVTTMRSLNWFPFSLLWTKHSLCLCYGRSVSSQEKGEEDKPMRCLCRRELCINQADSLWMTRNSWWTWSVLQSDHANSLPWMHMKRELDHYSYSTDLELRRCGCIDSDAGWNQKGTSSVAFLASTKNILHMKTENVKQESWICL